VLPLSQKTFSTLLYPAVMTEARDVAAEISSRLPNVRRGSLVVFGDIFGGRIDNIHIVTSAEVAGQPEHLLVRFDNGETLEVWDTDYVVISAEKFRIEDASRVRWEWFYYGRPQTASNRYFIEHVSTGSLVTATTNATWAPSQFAPDASRPAVELL
jgi:hypothetical protein